MELSQLARGLTFEDVYMYVYEYVYVYVYIYIYLYVSHFFHV